MDLSVASRQSKTRLETMKLAGVRLYLFKSDAASYKHNNTLQLTTVLKLVR